MLTQRTLQRKLRYDKRSGVFRWRVRISQAIRAGSIAGTRHPSGYVFIKIDGRSYAAHRLAWLFVRGVMPKQIDHRDRRRSNNRWRNLRKCSGASENNQNAGRYRSNRSGFVGVGWHAASGNWRARINVNGRQHHLGLFSSAVKARRAYLRAKKRLHRFNPVS